MTWKSCSPECPTTSHSGVSSISDRASESVWWPGIQANIEKTRVECKSCDISAPSQPATSPTSLPSPAYPFEQICADYFSYNSHKYLVIVDRFSNWPTVHQVKAGTEANYRDFVITSSPTVSAKRSLPTVTSSSSPASRRPSSSNKESTTVCPVSTTPTATSTPSFESICKH